MSKNVLDNLFGSKARVKIIKFMFRNYPNPVGVHELAWRTQEPVPVVQRELQLLRSIRLVKKKRV